MNPAMNKHLAKAIADLAIFLEFTDANLLNEDAAVGAMEQLAAELQLMDAFDRSKLSEHLKTLAATYSEPSVSKFVEMLPVSLGLE